jgi:hypothetical protein
VAGDDKCERSLQHPWPYVANSSLPVTLLCRYQLSYAPGGRTRLVEESCMTFLSFHNFPQTWLKRRQMNEVPFRVRDGVSHKHPHQ